MSAVATGKRNRHGKVSKKQNNAASRKKVCAARQSCPGLKGENMVLDTEIDQKTLFGGPVAVGNLDYSAER